MAAPTPAPPPMIAASLPFEVSASAECVFVTRAIVLPPADAPVSVRLIFPTPLTLPAPSAETTLPSIAVPLSRAVFPSTITASARFPVNVSPALFFPESSEVESVTLRDVPAGMTTGLGLAVSAFGLSASGAPDAAGAPAFGSPAAATSPSADLFSLSGELEQAPAIARINTKPTAFQRRIIGILLLGSD